MTDGTTAPARLQRLLYILPAASREGGASVTALAEILETTPQRILDDITQVWDRAFYHPGGWPDDIQVMVEADRLVVHNAGGLSRPIQLAPLETVSLALGLRGTAAASHLPDPEARAHLLERAETYLAALADADVPDAFAAPDLEPDEAEVRQEILAAARHRRTCAILYMKSGADDAEARVIHPYTVVYAQGSWYAVGWCAVHEGIRIFRTDRILEASRTEHTFRVPEGFRAEDFIDGGKVYHAPDDDRVRVRYSPRIARWVRERAQFEGWTLDELEDGSVVTDHPVADPHWVVRHALQYGADAEVVEPESYRVLVREVVEGMGG